MIADKTAQVHSRAGRRGSMAADRADATIQAAGGGVSKSRVDFDELASLVGISPRTGRKGLFQRTEYHI
jgi:hypothetical protein